jgi:hypothetical protein
MGKRFVPVRDADRRAIKLYLVLCELEKMPLYVAVQDDLKTIYVGDKDHRSDGRGFSVDWFLGLDLKQAKQNGGTFRALTESYKPPRPRIPQKEVDRAVDRFISGEDNE